MGLTDIQKECIDCQLCCRTSIAAIPGNTRSRTLEYAYLYYLQGHTVLYNPSLREWLVSYSAPCIHIGLDGCRIYDTRPKLCREQHCGIGFHRVDKYMEILRLGAERILLRLAEKGTFN